MVGLPYRLDGWQDRDLCVRICPAVPLLYVFCAIARLSIIV